MVQVTQMILKKQNNQKNSMGLTELLIQTDGGARSNPGPAGVGGVAYYDGGIVYELSKYIGKATNNEAEYTAVVKMLQWLIEWNETDDAPREITQVYFQLDSKLVVEQLSKRWKIKEPRMRDLAENCWGLMEMLPYFFEFSHIPREKNSVADGLVNAAIDAELA